MIGDLFMAEVIKLPHRMFGAMPAFSGAHILYIIAFISVLPEKKPLFNYELLAGLIFYGLVTIIVWKLYMRNPAKSNIFNYGGLVYGLIIAIMASFALSISLTHGGFWWLAALGALLFVISDLIIGITKIGNTSFRYSELWVWLTYITGQLGIIYTGLFSAPF